MTRPVTFSGSRLFVNAAVQPQGYLKIGVLTRDGKPVAEFTLNDCQPVRDDATKIPVTWSGGEDIQLPAGEHLRLQFQLQHADLYSFWVE